MSINIPPGTILSPQIFSVNTVYDSDIIAIPEIAVYKVNCTAGKAYMMLSETDSTEPLFTLDDSEIYVYKPSTLTYTEYSYDYHNDDDLGPELAPYNYDLGLGSRVKFIADETGWYVVIIAKYGTNF